MQVKVRYKCTRNALWLEHNPICQATCECGLTSICDQASDLFCCEICVLKRSLITDWFSHVVMKYRVVGNCAKKVANQARAHWNWGCTAAVDGWQDRTCEANCKLRESWGRLDMQTMHSTRLTAQSEHADSQTNTSLIYTDKSATWFYHFSIMNNN